MSEFNNIFDSNSNEEKKPSDASSSAIVSNTQNPATNGAIDGLRFFAWLGLLLGIVSAIVIWLKFGSIEVPISSYSEYTKKQTNYIGIGIGIAVLFQSIVMCSFFLVVAGAAEDIAAIRKKITS